MTTSRYDPTVADPHPISTAAELLATHGIRVTGQRVTVLDAMLHEPNDVTAQVLHDRLHAHHPTLGIATVYRTLNALADAGVLDRLHHAHGSTCFRYCGPGHHHHLTCRQCHAVVELRECELGAWAAEIGARHGFTGVQHAVELEGTCEACASAAERR